MPSSNDNDTEETPLRGIQYLGVSGIAHRCLDALVTLLTGPMRPQRITAVFHPIKNAITPHEAVCFIAWLPDTGDFVIIPDGFGTHGGGGGHGLQLAFRLIRFYDIPLDEVEASDQEQFRRIKRGRMLEHDIDLLHQAAHHFMFNAVLDYGFLERDKPDIWNEVLSTTDYALMFPYWIMEEELLPEIVDFAERPDLAVLLCTK